MQVRNGEILLGFRGWSGATPACESPPAFQDGWKCFCMRVPRRLRDLTPPRAAGSTAHPTASTAAVGTLVCPTFSKAKDGLRRSEVIPSASLRLGFQREATWHFLAL